MGDRNHEKSDDTLRFCDRASCRICCNFPFPTGCAGIVSTSVEYSGKSSSLRTMMGMLKTLAAVQILVMSSVTIPQQHHHDYSVTISTESQHFKSTDDIWIDIEIRNISKRAITCSRGPVSGALDIAFQYEVQDATLRVIPRKVDSHPEIGGDTHGWPCLLRPGETARSIAFVGRFYDMHLPGKYLIQISQKDSRSGQVIKSNQIEITMDHSEVH